LSAIDRYEVRGVPFAAWLYRIAGNLVANHHRRRQLQRQVPPAPTYDESHAAGVDDRRTVRDALDHVSENDREVIALYYFAGLKPAEMAQVLGCSVAAVHKRLHRARERMRREIEAPSGAAESAD